MESGHPRRSATRAFLLDLDGTLLKTRGGGDALLAGFGEVHGIAVSSLPELPMGGATDLGLLELLHRHINHSGEDQAEPILCAYHHRLAATLESDPAQALDGSATLLQHLAAEPSTRLGILTGNTRQGARLKLASAGLGDAQFEFGAFGDEHPDRNELCRRATMRARAAIGEQAEVWVVGDTPKDIACARSAGVSVAAVATGTCPSETLLEHQPDILADHLAEAPLAELFNADPLALSDTSG